MLDKLYITPRQWLRILRWTPFVKGDEDSCE